jgi:hypothetical protein
MQGSHLGGDLAGGHHRPALDPVPDVQSFDRRRDPIFQVAAADQDQPRVVWQARERFQKVQNTLAFYEPAEVADLKGLLRQRRWARVEQFRVDPELR